MLEIERLTKTFNPGTITEKRALTDLSLHLAPGDFVTVIGGNGAAASAGGSPKRSGSFSGTSW